MKSSGSQLIDLILIIMGGCFIGSELGILVGIGIVLIAVSIYHP